MGELVGLVFVAALFGGPLVLLVLFVQWRAKARRARLEGPWGALAQRYGGQLLAGPKVFVPRGTHQLSLEMRLVSVMQAVAELYPDGGTFTVARVAFDPAGPVRVAEKRARVSARELAQKTGIAQLAQLPADAWVVVDAKDAKIILHGAVDDAAVVSNAFDALVALAEHVQAQGSLGILDRAA